MKTMDTNLHTRTFSTFEEAHSILKPVFDRALENPFLNWDWLQTYWNCTKGLGETLLLAGVFRGEEAVAAVPFRVRRIGGLSTAILLTEGRADRHDIAGERSPQVARAVLKALQERGVHAVRCTEVEEDSVLARVLLSESAKGVRQYPSPFRDLSANAPVDVKSNRTFQKRIPNYRKRLAAFGEVEFKVLDFDQDRAGCLAWLPRLFELHDLRHADRRNSWKSDRNREFLTNYLRDAERTNFLGFVTLLDGAPVAFDLGFRTGNRFTLYIPAFHPAFERFRLGHINRYSSFLYCKEAGITLYDFSRGDSFAKRVWSHGAVDSYAFTVKLGAGLLPLLAEAVLDLPVRAKLWVKESGVVPKVQQWVGFLRPKQAEPAVQPAGECELPASLRYSTITGLSLQSLTQLVELVFLTQTEQKDANAQSP